MHFEECAGELHDLIPASHFHHIPSLRAKCYALTFIMRTAKEWKFLPVSVLPNKNNLTTSLNIRWDNCQMLSTIKNDSHIDCYIFRNSIPTPHIAFYLLGESAKDPLTSLIPQHSSSFFFIVKVVVFPEHYFYDSMWTQS